MGWADIYDIKNFTCNNFENHVSFSSQYASHQIVWLLGDKKQNSSRDVNRFVSKREVS